MSDPTTKFARDADKAAVDAFNTAQEAMLVAASAVEATWATPAAINMLGKVILAQITNDRAMSALRLRSETAIEDKLGKLVSAVEKLTEQYVNEQSRRQS